MTILKMWVHMVWTTKHRRQHLQHSIRPAVFDHLIAAARSRGIVVNSIGGAEEHLHLLVSLGADQSIAELATSLKQDVADWINAEGLVQGEFAWQDDYYAVSVGENDIRHVRRHIRRQDQHHHKRSFAEEYQDFMAARVGA